MADADKLDKRIQSLPQELQDHILEFTIAIEPGLVTVDKDFQPPWQLRINQATRNKIAKQYYTESTFILDSYVQDDRFLAALPLSHLAKDHQEMISHFQLSGSFETLLREDAQVKADRIAVIAYDDMIALGMHIDKGNFTLVIQMSRFFEGGPKWYTTATYATSDQLQPALPEPRSEHETALVCRAF